MFLINQIRSNHVCVLLATSPWGLSKLWGGDVPTSNIYHSGPRLCRLLLYRFLIEPTSPSIPDFRCPLGVVIPLLTHLPSHRRVSARDHPPTWASPVSVLAYQKTFARLPLSCNFQSPILPALPCPRQAFQIPVTDTPKTESFILSSIIPIIGRQTDLVLSVLGNNLVDRKTLYERVKITHRLNS